MIKILILSLAVLCSRSVESAEPRTPTITAGIWGTVTLAEGDCMPVVTEDGQQEDQGACRQMHEARTVYILEPVKDSEIEMTHLKTEGRIIRQVQAGRDGFYEVELPDGVYSVFVDDDGQKYCNYFGGQKNDICPVKVKGAPEKFDITIDRATW
jgi:hypothetical protein